MSEGQIPEFLRQFLTGQKQQPQPMSVPFGVVPPPAFPHPGMPGVPPPDPTQLFSNLPHSIAAKAPLVTDPSESREDPFEVREFNKLLAVLQDYIRKAGYNVDDGTILNDVILMPIVKLFARLTRLMDNLLFSVVNKILLPYLEAAAFLLESPVTLPPFIGTHKAEIIVRLDPYRPNNKIVSPITNFMPFVVEGKNVALSVREPAFLTLDPDEELPAMYQFRKVVGTIIDGNKAKFILDLTYNPLSSGNISSVEVGDELSCESLYNYDSGRIIALPRKINNLTINEAVRELMSWLNLFNFDRVCEMVDIISANYLKVKSIEGVFSKNNARNAVLSNPATDIIMETRYEPVTTSISLAPGEKYVTEHLSKVVSGECSIRPIYVEGQISIPDDIFMNNYAKYYSPHWKLELENKTENTTNIEISTFSDTNMLFRLETISSILKMYGAENAWLLIIK
jgi:hypothetical protein